MCLFPEDYFNLRPGSLANGPKSKSASTEVCHIWDHHVKCDGIKRQRRTDRGNTDLGSGGISRKETCKNVEGLVTDWGTRREGNYKRGMRFWLRDWGAAVKES